MRHTLYVPIGIAALAAFAASQQETEFNDSIAYADSFGANTTMSGNSANNDADFFSFVSVGEYVTAEVVGAGAFPMGDSILGLRTQQGHLIAFSEDIGGGNLNSRISAYLPPGIYYYEVGAFTGGGGSYDLVLTKDPVNVMPLTVSGPNAGTTTLPGTGTQDVFTFTLAADSSVDSRVVSGGTDTALSVQFADGRVWFTNDDSGRYAVEPSFDLTLPAGTYYVHVTDFAGGAVPYTINHSETATTITDLCAAGSVTGFCNGRETRNLHSLILGGNQAVDLVTAAGPSSPMSDTIMQLYDNNLNYLLDVDDYQSSDFFSRIMVSLPAGRYFVGVRGYSQDAGDYVLTANCNLPFQTVAAAAYGRNSLSAPGAGVVDLATLDVCTPTTVRLDSTSGAASAFYGLMDANGLSLGASEWTTVTVRTGPSGRHRDRHTAVQVPQGTNYLFTWYRFDTAQAIAVDVRPPLECDPAGNLLSHGKAGDLMFMFADLAQVPGVNLAGENGLFCLPFPSPTLTTIGFAIAPANGQFTWGACPAPFGFPVYVQQGDFHTSTNWPVSPGVGTWRNVLILP